MLRGARLSAASILIAAALLRASDAGAQTLKGTPCITSDQCGELRCIRERCRVVDLERDRIVPPTADPVRPRYFGMTASAFAGAGFEGHNVVAYGGDLFMGIRM